jgi:phage/plasmid-like protein (TIGR03299 family)
VTGTRNAHEALAVAGLAGWNIRKLQQNASEVTEHGAISIANPEQVMLVRNDPFTGTARYLSTVGRTYGIKQNEDSADVIDALVAESGAAGLADAGQLDDGRRTFVTMRLPQTMHVAGIDPIELHLVVFNAHDGTASFRIMLVPYRIWCANQLSIAIKDKVRSVAIRHTSKSAINVAEIRSKLGLMYEYVDAFEKQAEQMLNTQMTTDEFGELVETVWPVDEPATSRTLNNARRRRGQLVRLWTSAETQAPIRGSRWAAWQAVTEYLDHYSPAKDARVRANRVLTSEDLAKKKQTAYDLLAA